MFEMNMARGKAFIGKKMLNKMQKYGMIRRIAVML